MQVSYSGAPRGRESTARGAAAFFTLTSGRAPPIFEEMKTISSIVFMGILGLIVGYLLFAKVGNSYLRITDLLGLNQGVMAAIGSKLYKYDAVRQNILIAGGVGALVGLVLSLGARRPRR